MLPLTYGYHDIAPTICLIAGVVYTFARHKLSALERLVGLVIILNIITDTSVYFLMHMELKSNFLYNFLLPIERAVTLYIYAQNESKRSLKAVHLAGILSVILIYGVGYVRSDITAEIHQTSNILTMLIVAALSYVQLRSISIGSAKYSRVIFFFSIANFIYLTISGSALSALPLANRLDLQFASNIYAINLIGYSLWSIILIFAILWKKRI